MIVDEGRPDTAIASEEREEIARGEVPSLRPTVYCSAPSVATCVTAQAPHSHG